MEIYVGARQGRPGRRARSTSAWSLPRSGTSSSTARRARFIVQDELVDRDRGDPRPICRCRRRATSTSASRRRRLVRAYEALIARRADSEPGVAVRPDDTWALMYTSGTTGKPKGAIRNHEGSALIVAGHGARHGVHARRHRAAGDADVPCELAVFRRRVHLLGATCVVDDRKSFDPEHLLRDARRAAA